MLLIFDFDGVFVPYCSFWQSLKEYGEKQNIEINDSFVNSIKTSITKNQEELNSTLKTLGINDLKYLYNLYLSRVTLKKGALEYLEFCNLKDIKYIFYSGASPERIIQTFNKFDIKLNIDDIYFAKSKNIQEIAKLKKKLIIKFGYIDNLIYIDDYPPALNAGKKNLLSTIMMVDDSLLFNSFEETNISFIDYKVETFSELKKITIKLLRKK